MIIKDFVRNEDGSCSFGSEVDAVEAETLIKVAITTLIQANLIDVGEDDMQEDFNFDSDIGGTTLQ